MVGTRRPLPRRQIHHGRPPGGKWRSDGVGADGKSFYVEGECRLDLPRLLVHTSVGSYDGPHAQKTVVRWELDPTAFTDSIRRPQKIRHRTLVRVRHDGFAGNLPSATAHGDGWNRVLAWLEAMRIPPPHRHSK